MFKELGSSGLGKYSEEYPVTTFEREVSEVFVRLLDVLLGCRGKSSSNCVPRVRHTEDKGYKGSLRVLEALSSRSTSGQSVG